MYGGNGEFIAQRDTGRRVGSDQGDTGVKEKSGFGGDSAGGAEGSISSRARRITVRTLRKMKSAGEKISMLTAYDALFAQIIDSMGVELILVGDSVGMVFQGEPHTLGVTLEEMIYHTRCVSKVTKRAMVIGDLPFMSYQVSPEQALESAGRLVKEGGAHAVKLEGGREVVPAIEKIVKAGIPVMGHIGLTPQSYHAMGGFVVQGRTPERAEELKRDAEALQSAGVFSIVLEGIPAELAKEITSASGVPTIGIGAGVYCDGQVLVTQDLLGITPQRVPSFVKKYAELYPIVQRAIKEYIREVKLQIFPDKEHSY